MADDICSEYHYHMLKRLGRSPRRKQLYLNIASSKPNMWAGFEKLAVICTKHNIDYEKYISFVFSHRHNVSIKELLNIQQFRLFNEHLKLIEQHKKIYNNVLKTSKFIADECVKNNIETTIDYIKYVVINDQLAELIISGKISKYWISSIKKLDQLIERLNGVSQDTLKRLSRNRLLYYDEAQETFKMFTGKRYNIFYQTDKLIQKKYDND